MDQESKGRQQAQQQMLAAILQGTVQRSRRCDCCAKDLLLGCKQCKEKSYFSSLRSQV